MSLYVYLYWYRSLDVAWTVFLMHRAYWTIQYKTTAHDPWKPAMGVRVTVGQITCTDANAFIRRGHRSPNLSCRAGCGGRSLQPSKKGSISLLMCGSGATSRYTTPRNMEVLKWNWPGCSFVSTTPMIKRFEYTVWTFALLVHTVSLCRICTLHTH